MHFLTFHSDVFFAQTDALKYYCQLQQLQQEIIVVRAIYAGHLEALHQQESEFEAQNRKMIVRYRNYCKATKYSTPSLHNRIAAAN